mgnify:CR=1 FL=1
MEEDVFVVGISNENIEIGQGEVVILSGPSGSGKSTLAKKLGEIYNINVNKGCGLQSAIEYYNIDPKNVIAIGDGHNDIEMFNIANIKVYSN